MATLKDIAQRTGVSIAAVSMALKNHPRIGATRRKAIQAVARELGYEPDMVAQAMRTQRSHTIGMLVSNFRVPVANLRSDMIEQAIAGHGYRVQIAFTQSEPERLVQQIRTMRAMRVEGLVVHGSFLHSAIDPVFEELRRCRFPVVLTDFLSSFEDISEFAHVRVDRVTAMRRLVEHLAATGRKDILFLGAELRGTNGEKFRGVHEACKALGLRLRYSSMSRGFGWTDPEEALAVDMKPIPGLYPRGQISTRALHAISRRMIKDIANWKDLPDTIIATNDELAMLTVAGLQKHRGLRVPQDIAVTGYDDIPSARLFIPPLTTVRDPRKTLARKISSMLLTMLNGQELENRSVTITPMPVIRHSTLPASR